MKSLVHALMVLVLCILASALGLACVTTGPETETLTAEPTSISVPILAQAAMPTPEPTTTIMYEASSFRFNRPPTLDWQIGDSVIIVVASLLSIIAGTEVIAETPTYYRPKHVLRFRADEYLKGSGPSEFTVEVLDRSDDSPKYGSEPTALNKATESVEQHNTEWDDHPGVLFLEGPLTSVAGGDDEVARRSGTPSESQVFNLTFNTVLNQSPFEYTVDTLSRAWLPAEDSGSYRAPDGTRNSGDVGTNATDREFIMDGSVDPPSVISIADLRARISEVEAMFNAGDGSEAYTNCVKGKLQRPWWYVNWEEPYPPLRGRLASGAPADSEFGTDSVGGGPNDSEYGDKEIYLTGEQEDLFYAQLIDDDNNPANGYAYSLRTARPLPAGEYRLHARLQLKSQKVCNYRGEHNEPGYLPWDMTVTAPAGTLHEAFFDPTVAGTNDVSPAEFTVNGTSTEITGLEWSNDEVVLTPDSHVSLSGHVLEFISLDGNVSLPLLTDSATVDSVAGTYSWSMASQPWENGDQLMLRIRKVRT